MGVPSLGYRHRSRKRRLLDTVVPLSMQVRRLVPINESTSDSGDVFSPFGVDKGVLLLQRCDDTRESSFVPCTRDRAGCQVGQAPGWPGRQDGRQVGRQAVDSRNGIYI